MTTEHSETTEDEQTVWNSLSYFDMLLCMSWPKHPLARMAEITGFFLLVVLAISYFQLHQSLDIKFLTAMAILVAIEPFLSAWIYFLRNRGQLTEQCITINKDGIYCKTKMDTTGKTAWTTIVAVLKPNRATAIQFSQKPNHFYWIPDASFKSAQDAQIFYQKALQYWKQARLDAEREAPPIGLSQLDGEHISNAGEKVTVQFTYLELLIGNLIVRKKFTAILAATALLLTTLVVVEPIMFPGKLEPWFVPYNFGIVIIILSIIPIQVWRLMGNHREWTAGHIQINQQGIISRVSGNESSYSWQTVRKVERFANLIFLHISNESALIIPLRCFTTPLEGEHFYSSALQYCQSKRD